MGKHMKEEKVSYGIDWGHKDSRTVEDVKYFGNYHFGQAGWVCPKCGRIWSPITVGCHYCNSQKEMITGTLTQEEIVKMLMNQPAKEVRE